MNGANCPPKPMISVENGVVAHAIFAIALARAALAQPLAFDANKAKALDHEDLLRVIRLRDQCFGLPLPHVPALASDVFGTDSPSEQLVLLAPEELFGGFVDDSTVRDTLLTVAVPAPDGPNFRPRTVNQPP
jgi:hypothetical protein